MRGNIVVAPEIRRHGLFAHLLGNRNVVSLDLAVRMVRTYADPKTPAGLQKDKFHFAAIGRAPDIRPRRRTAAVTLSGLRPARPARRCLPNLTRT